MYYYALNNPNPGNDVMSCICCLIMEHLLYTALHNELWDTLSPLNRVQRS